MESEIDDVHSLKSKISSFQNDVKLNIYNYDAHVQLISLLSKLYCLYKSEELKYAEDSEEKKAASEQKFISFKKLRHSRQSMSIVFPLSIELWMKWIDDEMNADHSLVSNEVIEEIFSKATIDYLSVDIWCSYVIYLISRLEEGGSTHDFIRETLEKAVTNCGLHYHDGHKIWKCYQDFELKFLSETAKLVQEDNNETNVEQFKLQLLRVVKLYKREMSIALAKHDELLVDFRETVGPYINILKSLSSESKSFINVDEIENIHQKTSMIIKPIVINEEYLEENQHSFDAYQSYISHELESGLTDPARIQCLFERAIVHHCLKPTLWLDYIDFLNNIIKFPDLVIGVCKRALRNVTWDSRIDIKYATILEQLSRSNDEIRTIYEEGLQKYLNNGYNYCNLVISYLSFEKRICENKTSVIKKKPKIYQVLQQAVNQLDQIEDADKSIGEFVLFWVDVEKFWFKNEEKIKDIWKYMLSKYKSLWAQAMTFARTIGSADLVHDIFSIVALQFPDDIEMFSQSVFNYESTLGTFDSLNSFIKRSSLFLPSRIHPYTNKERQSLLSKIEHRKKFIKAWLRNAEETLFSFNKPEVSGSELSVKKIKRSHDTSDGNTAHDVNKGIKKIKRPHDTSDGNTAHDVNKGIKKIKRPDDTSDGNTAHDVNKGIKKIYLGLDDKEKQSTKRQHESNSDISTNNAPVIGPVLPAGFLPKSNDSEDSSEDEDDDITPPLKKQKVIDKAPEGTVSSELEIDSQSPTVFVSNLHPATKETDLKTIFSRAGDVQKIDLRKQKGGKIFAFITYSTIDEAKKAFELEHTPLLNRPLFVSQFKHVKHTENSSSDNPSAKYSQQQEMNKLFVSNLHKATTQLDLEKLFNQYGDMTSLRLISKKGASKPFAYVEYATVEAASRYLKAINNTIVRGHAIRVEYSNPSIGNRSSKPRQFSVEGNRTRYTDEDGRKSKSTGSITLKDSSDDGTFVKPKPVRLGLVPFQARSVKNEQSLSTQTLTKKGPAVRINFVPSNSNTMSKTETASDEADHKVSANNGEQSSAAAVSLARKSNDEFRKMFLKN